MDGEAYLEKYAEAKSYEERVELLQEAQRLENEDRVLFARKRDSHEVPELDDPYKGLLPLFQDESEGGATLLKKRKIFESKELEVPRLFQWSDDERKKRWASPPTVPLLKDFQQQFMQIFCCNALQYLDWNNVVAAGGAISACVQTVPEQYTDSLLQKRSYFHDVAYGASDIDLFLYALTPEQANQKLLDIYDAVCAACPFEVICFRSANAVSMVSQYPYRHVQVVLRIYSSPYEVLAGFDVDSCTILYDGKQVYTTPRGHSALMLGANTIDMSRRSPSYEMRLAKYGVRGFEVLIPDYRPEQVDPNIFDKPWSLLIGLQRLIVLDRLRSAEARLEYQTRNQVQSGKVMRLGRRYRDFGQLERIEKSGGAGESSNYATVFLPWGESYTARKVLKLMKNKDIAFNSKFFRKSRSYYLHPCFFGTAAEILQDCSPNDPELPDDVPASELRSYVRGPLTWMQDDPGQQQIGSFNPITETDWSRGAYFDQNTSDVVCAVNENDVDTLKKIFDDISDEWNMHQRDYVGRSPLHVGIMAGSNEACEFLLEHHLVDPTLRLPDGRSALHLAVEYNRVSVVKAMLSAIKYMMKAREEYDDLPQATKDEMQAKGIIPPRIIGVSDAINVKTFNTKLMPLELAVIMGNIDAARVLINDYKASPNSLITLQDTSVLFPEFRRDFQLNWSEQVAVPLITMIPPGEKLVALTELLLDNGCATLSSMCFDRNYITVLHVLARINNIELLQAVVKGLEARDPKLLDTLLKTLDLSFHTPLIAAVASGSTDCAKFLYSKFPSMGVSEEIVTNARLLASQSGNLSSAWWYSSRKNAFNTLKIDQVMNCLARSCEHLLLATAQMLDPFNRAEIFQHNRYRFESRDNELEIPSRDAYMNACDDLAVVGSLYDDESVSAEFMMQLRARVDNAAAMFQWIMDQGASEKLWEQEYDMSNLTFCTKVLSGNSRYYGEKEPTEGQKGTVLDVLKLLRKQILEEKESLRTDVNKATYCEALQAVSRKYPDSNTYAGYLVQQEAQSLQIAEWGNLNPTSDAYERQLSLDRVIEITEAFIARLDILSASIAVTRGWEPPAVPMKPARLSARRSMRGFLRNISTSKRSSVPRLIAGLTSNGASAEAAASAARMAAEQSPDGEDKKLKKTITKEEYIVQIENQLFRGFELQAPAQQYSYWMKFYDRDDYRNRYRQVQNTAAPENMQEFLFQTFASVFSQDRSTLMDALQRTDLPFPLLLVRDARKNSLLGYVCAILEDPTPVVSEMLQILDRDWVRRKKQAWEDADNDDDEDEDEDESDSDSDEGPVKRARKVPVRAMRIDNMKLAARLEDGSSDSDDDDEGRDEDLVLDDNLDLDTNRADAIRKRDEAAEALERKPMAILLPKFDIIRCTFSFKEDFVSTLLPDHVRLFMSHVEEVRVEGGFTKNMGSYIIDTLKIAVLRNDIKLLELLLNYTLDLDIVDQSSAQTPLRKQVFAWCLSNNITDFAIALDNVEALRSLTRLTGGGSVAWTSNSRAMNLGECFKIARAAQDYYTGMTTVIETSKGGDRFKSTTKYNSEALEPLWINKAAFYGSRKVFAWLMTNLEDLVEDFETFLTATTSFASKRVLNFAEKALEKLYDGTLLHLIAEPSLADRIDTPAQLLAAIIGRTCLHVPVQCGPLGYNVIYSALEGLQVAFLENVLDMRTDLLNEPCAIIDARKKSKKSKSPNDPDFVPGPGGSEVLYITPIIYAAQLGSSALFRRLLELGANPHATDPQTGCNALHTMCQERKVNYYTNKIDKRRVAAAIAAVQEVCGSKELLRAMRHRNKEGISCFQFLFSVAPPDLLEKLFESVVSDGWINTKMLQTAINSENVNSQGNADKINLLLKYFKFADLWEEDGSGMTILDQYAEKKVNLVYMLKQGSASKEVIFETKTNWQYGVYYGYGQGSAERYATYLSSPQDHPLQSNLEKVMSSHCPRGIVDFEQAQEFALKKLDEYKVEPAQKDKNGVESSAGDTGDEIWYRRYTYQDNAVHSRNKVFFHEALNNYFDKCVTAP